MNQFKRAQVVMLPTKNKSFIWSHKGRKLYSNQNNPNDSDDEIRYYLYIISDNEIKESDWCYDKSNKKIVKVIYKHKDTKNHYFVSSEINNEKEILSKGYSVDIEELNKIIATTDTSLNETDRFNGKLWYNLLPQPSQQFVEKYIESYNKGEIITDVLVEYEADLSTITRTDCGLQYWDYKLKINPKDNTITIKKLKDSWNKEELIAEIRKYAKDSLNVDRYKNVFFTNEWIEKNL